MTETEIRNDFDEIARLSAAHGGGHDRYERFLAARVPSQARAVLDVGCGMGRLTASLAAPGRTVTGIDLSPVMIAQANARYGAAGIEFRCGDFFTIDFPPGGFDCVISAAALHHMPLDAAIARMIALLRPGGTLVIHDLRAAANMFDLASSAVAAIANGLDRFIRTGRVLPERMLREAWAKHGARETYLTMHDVLAVAQRLPGAAVFRHFFWRYTIVWRDPSSERGGRGLPGRAPAAR
jgi:2-polyprenyl-3-methyl-5-hydroxy-6-metoxy-1,4-benzoquinol methylase